MRYIKTFATVSMLSLFCNVSPAQQRRVTTKNSLAGAIPPALSAISENELKTDLFNMSGDHFRGREAGTLDEMKVSVWLADQAKAAGLQPAGDDGTFYQFFTMMRNRVSTASKIRVGSKELSLWNDVFVTQTAPASVHAPIQFLEHADTASLAKLDLKGKAVAIYVKGETLNTNVSLLPRRYSGTIARKFVGDLTRRGVAAIIFVADSMADASWSQVLPALTRGLYDIPGGPQETVVNRAPVIWLHETDLSLVKQAVAQLDANIVVEHFEYPSVNIVGKIPGTSKQLSGEYVLFSGHQDHDGVRQPYGTDSIYNGADDNASMSVAMLAIVRAFHKAPGKRSALFVWHGAEERGLLGSRWFAVHPTVPKDSIVAVLNGDMIGRNNPDSAALLGVQRPHLNSLDLVSMAMEANQEGPKFKLDTLWDKPEHIEGWYFRSDHLPYARAGIPAIFYSSLLHSEYHTPMDEPRNIDLHKLQRMTEWIYRTGWKVANANARPKLEPGFKLER